MDTGEAIVSPTLLSPVLSFTIGSGTSGFAGSLVPTPSCVSSFIKIPELFEVLLFVCPLQSPDNPQWQLESCHPTLES